MRYFRTKFEHSLIESFPAMDVVERLPGTDGVVEVTADDTVAFLYPSVRYGGQWRAFSPGSVVSYARECHACPIEALDRARRLGHALHWFNPNSVSITAHKRERETWIGLRVGQAVRFEGRVFLVKSHRFNRDHVDLVDVTSVSEVAA